MHQLISQTLAVLTHLLYKRTILILVLLFGAEVMGALTKKSEEVIPSPR